MARDCRIVQQRRRRRAALVLTGQPRSAAHLVLTPAHLPSAPSNASRRRAGGMNGGATRCPRGSVAPPLWDSRPGITTGRGGTELRRTPCPLRLMPRGAAGSCCADAGRSAWIGPLTIEDRFAFTDGNTARPGTHDARVDERHAGAWSRRTIFTGGRASSRCSMTRGGGAGLSSTRVDRACPLAPGPLIGRLRTVRRGWSRRSTRTPWTGNRPRQSERISHGSCASTGPFDRPPSRERK